MSDFEKVLQNARNAQANGHEIDDATSRVIASMYHAGRWSVGYSFASTGLIAGPADMYDDLFPDYNLMLEDEKLLADMLGTYLHTRGDRPPVAGWAKLWV